VKVLVIGAVGGLLPGLLVVATYRLRSHANFSLSIFASRATSFGTLTIMLFPASFAYAILRHRLFDIRMMIRQGVRYAVARGHDALATLCGLYWYPLYSYLRRRGHSAEDAQDLTQGFFARLLEKHALHVVDPARGRFRSFLLASLDDRLERTGSRPGAGARLDAAGAAPAARGRGLCFPSAQSDAIFAYTERWDPATWPPTRRGFGF
jgi:hypothetical protein